VEKRQVDAAREQVAEAKARARPWRPIFLTALAVVMAAVSRSARTAAASEVLPQTAFRALGHTGTEALADAAAVAFGLLASLATTGFAASARQVLQPKIGDQAWIRSGALGGELRGVVTEIGITYVLLHAAGAAPPA
jgi:hypothetical protein